MRGRRDCPTRVRLVHCYLPSDNNQHHSTKILGQIKTKNKQDQHGIKIDLYYSCERSKPLGSVPICVWAAVSFPSFLPLLCTLLTTFFCLAFSFIKRSGAFVLLPKFAYGEEELKKSYWIKQYSPEVLGVEDSGAHGSAAPTKEDLVLREALDKINRIEEHLGIPKQ